MKCRYCSGEVVWVGSLINNPSTECEDCGETNCQAPEEDFCERCDHYVPADYYCGQCDAFPEPSENTEQHE